MLTAYVKISLHISLHILTIRAESFFLLTLDTISIKAIQATCALSNFLLISEAEQIDSSVTWY